MSETVVLAARRTPIGWVHLESNQRPENPENQEAASVSRAAPRWSRRYYMSDLGEGLLGGLDGRVLATADARLPAPIAPALDRLLEGHQKHSFTSIATRAPLVKWELVSSGIELEYLLGYKDVSPPGFEPGSRGS